MHPLLGLLVSSLTQNQIIHAHNGVQRGTHVMGGRGYHDFSQVLSSPHMFGSDDIGDISENCKDALLTVEDDLSLLDIIDTVFRSVFVREVTVFDDDFIS